MWWMLFLSLAVVGGVLGWGHAQSLKEKKRLELRNQRKAEKLEARQKRLNDDQSRISKVIDSGVTETKRRPSRPSVILLVEDSPTMMLALRKILERSDYKVVTATDGRKAWGELQKQKPDLVLSDIDMPELNGIELLKLMRTDLILMDVPVILITGSPYFHIQASTEAGVSGLLAKPFEDRALLQQVKYVLQE
jgi:two-component system chemotaxis response regulator CheY